MPTRLKTALPISVVAAALFLSSNLSFAAAFDLFTERALWTNAVSTVGSEDFESYNWYTGVENGMVLAWSIADTKTAALSGVSYTPTDVLYGIESLGYDAEYLTSQYIEWQTGGPLFEPNTLAIRFASPIKAAAFDFGTFRGEVTTYNIALDNGLSFTANTKPDDWNFFGVIADLTFQTVTITADLYPVLDNLAWGNAVSSVPEPSSLALMMLALAALRVPLGRRPSAEAKQTGF